MADKTGYDRNVIEADGTPIPLIYADQGDGTYAEKVSVAIAAPEGGATEAKQDDTITAIEALETGIVLAAGTNNIGDVDIATITAGENVIGRVDGTLRLVEPTITVDTAAYSAGDTLGGKLTLTGALRVAGQPTLLYEILLTDAENQKPTGTILLFNADPTAATTTDNAAFAFSTDITKLIAEIPVASGDWTTIAGDAVATISLSRIVTAASGTALYAVFVTSSTPDYAAGTDLRIVFKFL